MGLMREKRIVWENMFSLAFVQGVNYILPLITIPYLVRVLGIEGFGLYSFVYSLIQYFVYLTDYGFNLSASRKVSINRDRPQMLSDIFISVMAVKTILLVLSGIVLMALVLTVGRFRSDAPLFYVSFLSVLGNMLFPIWYYIGIEKTKYIALFNLVTKLLSTAAIFIFIRAQGHLIWAVFIQSMGVVAAGILSMLMVYFRWPVKLVRPSLSSVLAELKDGWNVFITLISSTLVNNTNIFILGMLTNNVSVGYYSVADKIVRAFINLASPVSVAIYPQVSRLINNKRVEGIEYLRKVLRWGTLAFGILVLILTLGSGLFVRIVSGAYSAHIRNLILIMSVLPLTIFWDNIYGTQVLINIGQTRRFMKAVLIPGLVSLGMSFVLVPLYKETATATIFLMSECMILFLMVHYARKSGIYLARQGLF